MTSRAEIRFANQLPQTVAGIEQDRMTKASVHWRVPPCQCNTTPGIAAKPMIKIEVPTAILVSNLSRTISAIPMNIAPPPPITPIKSPVTSPSDIRRIAFEDRKDPPFDLETVFSSGASRNFMPTENKLTAMTMVKALDLTVCENIFPTKTEAIAGRATKLAERTSTRP